MRRSRATQQWSNEEVPASVDGIPRFKAVDGVIGIVVVVVVFQIRSNGKNHPGLTRRGDERDFKKTPAAFFTASHLIYHGQGHAGRRSSIDEA
ncbi:hypothetical protein ASPBRDRAFT_526027 [Aspergillus brasiliensis CBS 101740]|uniref:Uncharacterized protein n=1 Tax=Aspergillus brasiliensis (strain CBS 101740 / IMI 381727 / IBT 21946) TaxID=767769 RepID=A0A1L9UQJ4_ASPBC|nr:hypothetical protein ASPBRDRAFT_526027 [Aspergillus brasiliensis CBS 101740]